MHILPNISRSKDNQILKFTQVKECNNRNIFLQKSCKKWVRETSSRPLFIFYKRFIWAKSKWSATQFQSLSIALNLANNQNRIYKTLEYWSRHMLDFDILEKSLRIVPLLHFMYDFSRKVFLILYSIDWANFIDWLPLLSEILVNTCIAIVC